MAPPVVDHNNYEPLPDLYGVDNFENLGLAKDSSEPSYPVKRHAILPCHNHPALENNKPYKSNLITSEWKMKSTPVDNAYGDLMVKKSKVAGLKKIEINSQKLNHEPLHRTLPLLQKENLIGENPKHSLLQLNLQDKENQIKSLISTPQHIKLNEIISDKLVDETLHNKLTQPSLTLPVPYKSIKYPLNDQLIQPTEIHNNIDTAGLITDSDKQSNPLKLSPLLPHIPNNQNDLKNKPSSTFPSVQFNKPKPVDILRDRSPSQLIQTPAIKPVHLPIIVQKEVSLSSVSQRPQANIDSSSQYPKIIKNDIAESTSQPILISLSHNKQKESIDVPPSKSIKTSDTEMVNKPITIIEKKVSIYYPHQKSQDSIDLPPPKQLMKISNTETVNKPIKIEKKEISISAPNEQKQPIIDLPPQAPQLIKTPDQKVKLKDNTVKKIAISQIKQQNIHKRNENGTIQIHQKVKQEVSTVKKIAISQIKQQNIHKRNENGTIQINQKVKQEVSTDKKIAISQIKQQNIHKRNENGTIQIK
ncbi:uncharacterized protein LOC115033558 [Acyrthosiphon pisum]|uniref:Uncharacterized protein n=1 Tax=Acyrthosiphon pisum TaxID=7029 RepID=A0A8R2NLA7_ACYPI|nr:uncharacterized protein LOC115033558 [Acyrthosiphon pisum]